MSPRTAIQNEQIREKSREKIVLAAMELFSKQSFHRTSVADIARTAGISKGLIYNYFETKEDILRGIIDYMFAIGDQIMEESRAEGDPRKKAPPYDRTDVRLPAAAGTYQSHAYSACAGNGAVHFHQRDHRTESRALPGRLVRILEELGYEDPEWKPGCWVSCSMASHWTI